MKLIHQSAKFIPQEEGIEGIRKQIEKAGRICYKSEDKITEDSSKEFVKRIIDNGHYAMLEHGTVYLKTSLPDDEITPTKSLYHYMHNPYSVYRVSDRTAYITTNMRVIEENGWSDDLKHICEPTEFHEKRRTMRLVTSIGIVRELLRHRVFSFANESTRYCNYSRKDKFNSQITFIEPHWCNDDRQFETSEAYDCAYEVLCSACEESEGYYNLLIDEGFHPQQAREVLPLCTKSELVMTGFESDWKRFFDLRLYGTTGKPHPDMLILAQLIKDAFKKNGIMF